MESIQPLIMTAAWYLLGATQSHVIIQRLLDNRNGYGSIPSNSDEFPG